MGACVALGLTIQTPMDNNIQTFSTAISFQYGLQLLKEFVIILQLVQNCPLKIRMRQGSQGNTFSSASIYGR